MVLYLLGCVGLLGLAAFAAYMNYREASSPAEKPDV